jgi:hypothetical protein
MDQQRIYVAARRRNAPALRIQRAMGYQIISSWIDHVDRPRPQQVVWQSAFDEIAAASAFIFYDGGDGALVELGIAMGMGLPLVIVVDPCDVMRTLPCVTNIATLDAALDLAQAAVTPKRHVSQHQWDRDGERCLKCGDKDWMGGPCRPRHCTCHPDDNPPVPCQRRYAITECRAAAGGRETVEEVLEVVGTYGPWGRDINEGLRYQIVLADEVKRLRASEKST